MARIRSIKPEFWTDGTNIEHSDSVALFYIALWNFCDDEGKHPLNWSQLVAELGGRWHRGKVKLFVSCLIKSGQLRINSDATWIQVTGWSHQKIDKPKQPKIKAEELQWLTPEESATRLEHSRGVDARIGSDLGGIKDRIKDKAQARKASRPSQAPVPVGRDIVAAYCDAYRERYPDNPVIRPQDAKALKNLGESLGVEKTKELLRAYLKMNNAWFITKAHDLVTFIQNLNQVQNFLATGQVVTLQDARNAEASDSLANQIKRLGGVMA